MEIWNCFSLVILLVCPSQGHDVHIVSIMEVGGRLPFEMRQAAPGIEIGYEKARRILNSSVTLHLSIIDGRTSECSPDYIGTIAAEVYYTGNVSVFIGPGCSLPLEYLGRMAAQWNIPVATTLGTSRTLGNKKVFSTLTRLSYNVDTLSQFYAKIMKFFKWKHSAFVYDATFAPGPVLFRKIFEVFTHHSLYTVQYSFNSVVEEKEGTIDDTVTSILFQASKVTRGIKKCCFYSFSVSINYYLDSVIHCKMN